MTGALEWSGIVLFCRETEVGSVKAIWWGLAAETEKLGNPGVSIAFFPYLPLWVLAGVGRQAGLMVVR